MSPHRTRHSALYVPPAHPRALQKALTLEVDTLLFDLEDATAPEKKSTARQHLFEMVSQTPLRRQEWVLRLNGPQTPWFQDDLQMACVACPDAILIPKISTPEEILAIEAQLLLHDQTATHRPIAVFAMIETSLAFFNLRDIASLAWRPNNRLQCLVLGLNDLTKETGIVPGPNRHALLPWMGAAVMAAKACQLDLLDGVCNAFQDLKRFEAECLQARHLGMTGKTLLHPDQIAPCHRIFSPTPEERAWAQKVVDLFSQDEHQEKNVCVLEGQMVERLHFEQAKKLLQTHSSRDLSQKDDS